MAPGCIEACDVRPDGPDQGEHSGLPVRGRGRRQAAREQHQHQPGRAAAAGAARRAAADVRPQLAAGRAGRGRAAGGRGGRLHPGDAEPVRAGLGAQLHAGAAQADDQGQEAGQGPEEAAAGPRLLLGQSSAGETI